MGSEPVSEKEFVQMWEEADPNGDGKIAIDEFVDFLLADQPAQKKK